jgi:hypothetical protein
MESAKGARTARGGPDHVPVEFELGLLGPRPVLVLAARLGAALRLAGRGEGVVTPRATPPLAP